MDGDDAESSGLPGWRRIACWLTAAIDDEEHAGDTEMTKITAIRFESTVS